MSGKEEVKENVVALAKNVAKDDKERMRNLVEMSKLITSADSFYEIKDTLVEMMLGTIRPSKACVNLFYGNDYRYAHLVCSDTLKFVQLMFPQNEEIGTKFDFNRCPQYIHEAVKEQKIVVVENLFEDERAAGEAPLALQEGYVGRIVIPFVVHGTTIGFLTCCLTKEDDLSPDEVDYLSQVASLMSLSVTITEKNKGIKGLINKLKTSMDGITTATRQDYSSEDLVSYLGKMAGVLTQTLNSKYASINVYELQKGDKKRERKIGVDFPGDDSDKLAPLKEAALNGDRLIKTEHGEFELANGEKINNYMYYTFIIGDDEEIVVICADSENYIEDDEKTLAILSKQIISSIKSQIYSVKAEHHKEVTSGFSVLKDQQKLIMNSANNLKAFSNSDVYFYHETSNEVGGDFYNAVEKDGRVLFMISDIMGHGVVSNYIVALIKGAFDILSQGEVTPAEVLCNLNENLHKEFDEMGVFATALVGIYDKHAGRLTISNAGHYFPIFIDQEGNITAEQEGIRNIPIGILPGREYKNVIYDLKGMKEVVFFTDGILEIKNTEGEEFGMERFCDFLLENIDASKEETLERLKSRVDHFSQGNEIRDDMLVVFMKKKND